MYFQKKLKMTKVEQVIKYAKMLNSKNLSALRSGNISIRYNDGFFITPSGAKYDSLKELANFLTEKVEPKLIKTLRNIQ